MLPVPCVAPSLHSFIQCSLLFQVWEEKMANSPGDGVSHFQKCKFYSVEQIMFSLY